MKIRSRWRLEFMLGDCCFSIWFLNQSIPFVVKSCPEVSISREYLKQEANERIFNLNDNLFQSTGSNFRWSISQCQYFLAFIESLLGDKKYYIYHPAYGRLLITQVYYLTWLFPDGGRYHIETSPANQWTGFYMITASGRKELNNFLIWFTTKGWWIGSDRSSRPEVFCKIGVLRNFEKFTGKHLCQRLFFNEVAGLGCWLL